MYYIQEIDKLSKIYKILNNVKLEQDKIILPVNEEEINEEKTEKLVKKTIKILNKTNCNKIVISKKIQKQEKYVNLLHSYKIDIVDGNWLFSVLSLKALENIIEKRNMKKEEIQISILVNDISEITLINIKKIIKKYKKVNIVTNHIEKFKKIEKQILEEYGIMITVTNNKRKSLSKSQIILNVDFPTELLGKYNIYEKAVIVNLRGNVKIENKRFNGININDYEIVFNNEEEFDYSKEGKYKVKEIYESKTYKNQPYSEIMKKIKRDKVEILALYGNNIVL